MCGDLATTTEHAPPLCLFPEAGAGEKSLRRNLMTVRACDRHNANKSGDDELMRLTLTMMAGPKSPIAERHFFGKVLSGVERSRSRHYAYLNPINPQRALAQLDRGRFEASVDHMIRAIHFHTYRSKWLHPMAIAIPGLVSTDGANGLTAETSDAQAAAANHNLLFDEPLRGANPEVFSFKVRRTDRWFAFEGLFYSTVVVCSWSTDPSSEANKTR